MYKFGFANVLTIIENINLHTLHLFAIRITLNFNYHANSASLISRALYQ